MCGLCHRRRRVHHLEHARGRAPHALKRLGRGRQRSTSSNATSGISAIPASSTPFIRPAWTAETPTSSAPHIASPSSRRVRPWPIPAVRALCARDRRELRVRRVGAAQLLGRGPVDGQLWSALAPGRPPRVVSSRAPPLPWPRRARQAPRSAMARATPASTSATSRIRPAAGQHPPHQPRRSPRRRGAAIANAGTTRSSRSCSESTSCDQSRKQVAACETPADPAEPAARAADRR